MFNWLNKKPSGEKKEFKVLKMHCVSCAMNIDGELEELEGVISSDTNYAKGKTVLEYEPEKLDFNEIKKVIEKLGYEVEM